MAMAAEDVVASMAGRLAVNTDADALMRCRQFHWLMSIYFSGQNVALT